MKTILVLTDLSKKAENAAVYALKIAEKTHANIILFHSFEKFQAAGIPESDLWGYEDYEMIKNESLKELKKLEDYLVTRHEPGAFEPEISLLNELGFDLGIGVSQIVKNKNIDLVIMGTKGDDTVSHLFSGSEANGVLEQVACPVLFIPETGSFDPFKNIVFANDLKKDYNEAISFLVDLARIDDSHIIITHFGKIENNTFDCLNFIKYAVKYTNVTCNLFPLKNVGGQLREFSVSAQADLVAMIHHKEDRLENFISGSKCKNMLNDNHIPLLILQG
jgi:nucleotide-binding universal stress UspA family protein